MDTTLDYYDRHAGDFYAATVDLDMAEIRQRFTARLPAGGTILDAGCGSGRDGLAFLGQGYRVVAFDASAGLARLAGELIGQSVAVRRFEDVDEVECFDGIWACASLLHLPEAELPAAFGRLWRALRRGGVLYCSFKFGSGERLVDGRHFTDADEGRLRRWIDRLDGPPELEIWQSEDRRPERSEVWLNALLSA